MVLPRLSYAKFINMYMNPPEINESTSSSSMEWIKKIVAQSQFQQW